MSSSSFSSSSSDDESPSPSSKPTMNSNSSKLTSRSANEIELIIGINQQAFIESEIPIMFYVKYFNKSYRCCKWINKEELLRTKRGNFLYKKFLKNPTPFRPVPLFNQMVSSSYTNHQMDIDPGKDYQLFKPTNIQFDRGFITPEKIISTQKNFEEIEYLVKWVSLDITESTWETDIPESLIDDYQQNNSNTHHRCYNNKLNENAHKFTSFHESPLYKNDHKLADYQIDALNWLQMCWFQKRNSILADEMGLGKTIESISILDILAKWYLSWGPFIVVCPLSTVSNWIEEIEEWTNLRVVCLIGNEKSRDMIKKNLIFQHIDDKGKLNMEEIIFDVLIVSYEMLSKELSFIKKFSFMYMIIDEAQKLKNSKSITYQNCASIRSYHTLLMTGTPIQNDIYEMWSLLHFISPSEFANYESFFEQYQDKEDAETIEKLQELLRPFIFRRKKNDVKLDIPEKEETIIEVEMTQVQRTFSQFIIKDNHDILSDISSTKFNLNNVMMQLRKLFCHPFLITELEPICNSQYREKNKIPDSQPLSYDDEMKSLIYASGKTILIDKLLPKLKEGEHKVLIFSQMTLMLDILEDYLVYKHYSYERLDGSCTNSKRAMSIQRFQKDEDIFVFLLSTRAGGLGINLTKADTVIIYDSDWNPQNDIQAQSRCYRIGQTKKVNVYRLITRGSYESEMFLRASKKLALDFAILDSGTSQSSSNSALMSNSSSLTQLDGSESEENQENLEQPKLNSRQELEMILKKGAYYTFKDDPNEIDKFCLENIEQILEHRSHTKKDLISGGNSKFSKVTFDGTTEEQDEINRSDFWENLVGADKFDTNDKDSSYYGIQTRHKKVINYAPKTEGEGDKEEEDEDQQSSSSDNDFEFIPSQSNEKANANTDSIIEQKPKQQPQLQIQIQKQTTKPIQQLQLKMPIINQQQIQNDQLPTLSFKLPITKETQFLTQFITPLNQVIYQSALNYMFKHGIAGTRLFCSEFVQEIGKSLISIAYLIIDDPSKEYFKDYIDEYIGNPKMQILKTPFKELSDRLFIRTLFKHSEKRILYNCYMLDEAYKCALYISNEKLPEKFIFAPEMDTPLGWCCVDDFFLITSSIFEQNFNNILLDNKLPYSGMSIYNRPSFTWIKNRIRIIFKHISKIIPKDYKATQKIGSEIKYKAFNNLKSFLELNDHVAYHNVLTVNEQKKILRIFYLYGIPQKNGLDKISYILKNKTIRIELINLFAVKVLIKAMKYRPNLCNLLKCACKVNDYEIYDNSKVDIRWIKKEAIQAVAINLDIFYRVRENFEWINSFNNDEQKIINIKTINIPYWTEILNDCPWWNLKCDRILFNITAYYGFFFNSMVAKFINISNISDENISLWRNEETLTLTPTYNRSAMPLFPVFNIDARIQRLNQILDLIQIARSKSQ